MAGLPFAYTPPAGWEQLEAIQITAGNQDQFPSAIGCALLDQHAQKVNGPDGAVEYRPPLGWWVVMIEQQGGVLDQVWISPSGGVAIQVGTCTGSRMQSGGTAISLVYFILAGLGIGFVLAPLFKRKES